MRGLLLPRICAGLLAIVAIAALVVWRLEGLSEGIATEITLRTPGTDMEGVTIVQEKYVPIAEASILTSLGGVAPDLPGRWPRFRGPNFDAISVDPTPLARTWPQEGPPVAWTIDVGEGYAGAAIWDGKAYVLDYDRDEQRDVVRCLSMADGKDIWRFSYPVKVKRNHGMSRTIPAVTAADVVTLGPKCHVVCLDADAGTLKWSIDLVRQWKTKIPQWYAGQCPLIDADRVILAPGGDALLLAVKLATGEVVWQTPNPDRWKMTHSSIMPMTLGDTYMYVYCGSGGVVGINAADGTVLWKTTDWKISIATTPSPLVLDDGRIFLTGDYNAGSMMLKVTEQDGRFSVSTQFTKTPKEFASRQHTPILFREHLFAVQYNGQLACMDLDGTVKWTSGSTHKFGLGGFVLAQGMLFVVNDTGKLTLVEATPQEYRQLAAADILHGHDAWGPPALAAGRLILRDLTQMACVDVSAN